MESLKLEVQYIIFLLREMIFAIKGGGNACSNLPTLFKCQSKSGVVLLTQRKHMGIQKKNVVSLVGIEPLAAWTLKLVNLLSKCSGSALQSHY